MESLSIISLLAIVSGLLSLVFLILLHLVSTAFHPGWRMVSEYALGKHKWMLTLFFFFWGLCSVLAAFLLWNVVTSGWATFGVVLVFISGIGAFMGGLFDIKHKLHGMSAMLGIPTLPIGALLITYHLVRNPDWTVNKSNILLSAHATWISLVIMGFSMVLLFSGFKKAGVPMGPNIDPPQSLPTGVIGISGYANRLLIVSYIVWPVLLAYYFTQLH